MGPRFLLKAVLLLAPPATLQTSQHCGRLEYWNPDNLCCASCLQRFGLPPCFGYEFSENCGLNDFGDHVAHPFQECPPGHCNPQGAQLCSPCGSEAMVPAAVENKGRTRAPRCREKPIPFKEPCPLATSRISQTAEPIPSVSMPSFVLLTMLVLLPAVAVSLVFALQRHCSRRRRKKNSPHPYPGFACKDLDTPFKLHWSTPGSPSTSQAGESRKASSLLKQLGSELPNLTSQPLSRLLDELEVLEELIVLLDPEPGPGGGLGTTRHLASRYGLSAVWSNFAYSLRPSHSPLRTLIEVVVAREPSASLGQLSAHLVQLGRADALQVLSRLGGSGACPA